MADLCLSITHVGLAVSNLTEAMAWYSSTLGFTPYPDKLPLNSSVPSDDPVFKVVNPAINYVEVGFMFGANGVGLELFEYSTKNFVSVENEARSVSHDEGPPVPSSLQTMNPAGFFHVAFLTASPKNSSEKVVAAGGQLFGDPFHIGINDEAIYTADPWGNILEFISTDFTGLVKDVFEVTPPPKEGSSNHKRSQDISVQKSRVFRK